MRPYQPKIALIVDNPLRDLPGLVLLASELLRRDFNPLLVPISTPRELWALAPDAIVFTYARNTNAEIIRVAYQHGIHVMILETEGGVFLGGIETRYGLLNIRAEIRECISLICAWGQQYADFIIEKGLYPKEKVVITGHPRFDFYHPSLRHIIEKLEIDHQETTLTGKKIILIATNFTYVNPRYTTPDRERQALLDFNFAPDYVDAMIQAQDVAWDGFLELIPNISACFPDEVVIVRPHPFENPKIYKDTFQGYSNIAVIQTGSIAYWLNRSNALIHWRSSTGIEASLMGIPSFIPNWLPSVEENTLSSVSLLCENMDDLLDKIRIALDQATPTSSEALQENTFLYNAFYLIDGQAHQRVAQAIEDVVGHPSQSSVLPALRKVAYDSGGKSDYAKWMDWGRSFLRLPINFTRHMLFNQEPISSKSAKLFSRDDVDRIATPITTGSIVVAPPQYQYPILNGKSTRIQRNS